MCSRFFGAAFEFGKLFFRQIGVIRFKFILEFIPETFQNLLLFLGWQRANSVNYFGNGHGAKLLR